MFQIKYKLVIKHFNDMLKLNIMQKQYNIVLICYEKFWFKKKRYFIQ